MSIDLGDVLSAATTYGDQREAAARAEGDAALAALRGEFDAYRATHPDLPPPPKPAPVAAKVIGMSAPKADWATRLAEVGATGVKARRIFADLGVGPQHQSALIEQTVAAGMLPVVSYKVGGNITGAASGTFDAVATQAANYLASFNVPIAVSIWHEPNGDMTGPQFVAIQQRLVPKFKIGKLRVGPILNGFLLTQPNQQPGQGVDEFTTYTTPALLDLWDWFGIDTYQPGTLSSPGALMPVERLRVLVDWLGKQGHPAMPVGVGEYNGFSAAAITGMGEGLLSIPNVWFGCLWNVDEARAGVLTGSRLDAYKATKADARAAH